MIMETITKKKEKGKKRVAWGITGSGDRLVDTVEIMKEIKERYQNDVDIVVYLSKAGDLVIKYYKLADYLKDNFDRIRVEIDANTPFLAGQLQVGKFEFLLIAPATSNTVAKIATGMADTLLCNAAIMGLKGFVPVYIMPSDYRKGIVVTKLPNGRNHKLRIREEDAEHVKALATMKDVFVLEKPEKIYQVFQKHFRPKED